MYTKEVIECVTLICAVIGCLMGIVGTVLGIVNSYFLWRERYPSIKIVPILVYDLANGQMLASETLKQNVIPHYIGVRVVRTSKVLVTVTELSIAEQKKWYTKPKRVMIDRQRVIVRNGETLPVRLEERNRTIECLLEEKHVSPGLYGTIIGFYVGLASGELILIRARFLKSLGRIAYPHDEKPKPTHVDASDSLL